LGFGSDDSTHPRNRGHDGGRTPHDTTATQSTQTRIEIEAAQAENLMRIETEKNKLVYPLPIKGGITLFFRACFFVKLTQSSFVAVVQSITPPKTPQKKLTQSSSILFFCKKLTQSSFVTECQSITPHWNA